MTNVNLDQLQNEDFCYLTTTGRISGRTHTIEIWFALHGKTLYILAGGREKSDWVKNILKLPTVQVRIGQSVFNGQGRVVDVQDGKEDAFARALVFDKYTPRDSDDLTDWARTSLPVAVDLEA
jgi:deazaflavin-dependent oxidoreductase (nitroreductase family)